MPKIVTDCVLPSISYRSFDWCAYYDGTEEDGNYGWGRTEEEAIQDLENTWPLEDYMEEKESE